MFITKRLLAIILCASPVFAQAMQDIPSNESIGVSRPKINANFNSLQANKAPKDSPAFTGPATFAGTLAVTTTVSAPNLEVDCSVGADKTGATDSTAAIQARINLTPKGGVCLFPNGYYKFSALTTFGKRLVGRGWQNLVKAPFGDSQWQTLSNFSGSILISTASSGYGLAFAEQASMSNIFVIGPGTGLSIGVGYNTTYMSSSSVWSHVGVANFYQPLLLIGLEESTMSNLTIIGGGAGGVVLDYATNNNHFPMFSMETSSGPLTFQCSVNLTLCPTGTHFIGPSGNTFDTPLFQGNTGTAIVSILDGTNNVFRNMWSEANATGYALAAIDYGIGNRFSMVFFTEYPTVSINHGTGNIFEDAVGGSGLYITPSLTANSVGNRFTRFREAAVTDAGTNNVRESGAGNPVYPGQTYPATMVGGVEAVRYTSTGAGFGFTWGDSTVPPGRVAIQQATQTTNANYTKANAHLNILGNSGGSAGGPFLKFGTTSDEQGYWIQGENAGGVQSLKFGNQSGEVGRFNAYGLTVSSLSAQGACDATRAGNLYVSVHATGIKDAAAICLADAANTWAWRTIY